MLIAKLSDLEWEDFEVKEAYSALPKNTWETVSAFSNTSGGWLIFGIKQTGKRFEIQGLKNPEKIEQNFLSAIRSGKFNAFVTTTQAKYEVDHKTLLAFYIPASKDKPLYYNSLKNTFIRRGSSDQRATNSEIDAMYRDQTFGTKTSEPAPNTSITDLHTTSLKQYRDYMVRFNPDVSYNRYDQDEFLIKLRIIDNGNCTYAGLLFFGKRESIEKHFPDFRIDLLEIPGTSISDAETNYTFRLGEFENLWDYYFECFNRLKSRIDVEFKLTEMGFGQELSPGLKAIREALVNMLMHADYFSPAHSRIRIFTNHIEFYNPGGLPKPLEELKAKDLSIPRNLLISKLFRMVRLAENAGFGFDKIESNWKAFNNTLPEYEISFDSTILKLNNETSFDKTDDESGQNSEKDPKNFVVNPEKLRNKIKKLSEELQREPNDLEFNKTLIISLLENIFDDFLEHLENNSQNISEKLRNNFGVTSEKLRSNFTKLSYEIKNELEKKPADINYVINLLSASHSIFTELISEYTELSSERVREQLGNSWGTVGELLGNKPIVFLLLIIFKKDITTDEAGEILGVSNRMVKNYIKKLKDHNMIERIGSPTFGGYWALKNKS